MSENVPAEATPLDESQFPDPFQVPINPEKVPHNIKARMAFELRKSGASYDFIVEKLGYNDVGQAKKAVSAKLGGSLTDEAKRQVTDLELQRLDALQLIAWRLAQQGDLGAIDRILKIMERRSKLLGLDQEQATQEVTQQTAIFIGGNEEDYVQALERARQQSNGKKG